MTYRLKIERWSPALLNDLMGHWARAYKLKKIDRNMVMAYCLQNRMPLANGPRRVSLTITLSPKQHVAPDPDAFWKSLLDALVHARMLIDDCRQYCEMGPVTFLRGPERETLIELEEL